MTSKTQPSSTRPTRSNQNYAVVVPPRFPHVKRTYGKNSKHHHPSKRQLIQDSDDDDDDDEQQEEQREPTPPLAASSDSQDSDDDEELQTPITSPSKPTTSTTKLKAQTTPESNRRQSMRVQNLPVAQADIDATPKSLRSALIGYHDVGSDSSSDESEQEYVRVVKRVESESPSKKRGRRSSSPTVLKQSPTKRRAVSPSSSSPSFSTPTKSKLATTTDLSSPSKKPSSLLSKKHPTRNLRKLWTHLALQLQNGPSPSPSSSRTPFSPTTAKTTTTTTTTILSKTPYVPGYESWERALRYGLSSVVSHSVGNCLILLGPRGVGKTMLVERTLAVLEAQFGKDEFVPVRLNGLVHTTDRLALRSIARQLMRGGLEEEVEEGDWGSNASTMATLLRLFEPPPTTTSTCNSNKSIILIIDEFDLFALHPRQSFLYSLLDIVQGNRRKTGVGVVGISSRTDCLSILEKRVRSRCQSQVHQVMLPNSREDYFERLRELLVVADDWQGLRGEDDGGMEETVEDWNAKVEAFCKDQDVKDYFERLWKIHGNVPTFLLQALSEMMAKLDYSAQHSSADWSSPAPKEMRVPDLDISLLPSVTTSEGKGKRDDLLQQCTTLELVVCVAAKHVRNIHEDNCLNLEMLYSCYKQHLGRTELKGGASAKAYSKMAFAMALDSLRQQEVFIPATGKSQHYFPPSLGDSFRQLKFVPWNSTVDEVVMERQDVPLPVRKWCKHWAD